MSKAEYDTATPKRTEWELKFSGDMSYPVVKVDGREVKPFLCVTKVEAMPFTIEHFRYSDVRMFDQKVKRGPGKGRRRQFPVHGMTQVNFDTEDPSKVSFGHTNFGEENNDN